MTYFLLILTISAIWISGYVIGCMRTKTQFSMNIIEDPDRILAIIQEIKRKNEEFEETHEPTEVMIEQHNDRFFVYNNTTKLFLGQGATPELALSVVQDRFPDQEFKVHDATQ